MPSNKIEPGWKADVIRKLNHLATRVKESAEVMAIATGVVQQEWFAWEVQVASFLCDHRGLDTYLSLHIDVQVLSTLDLPMAVKFAVLSSLVVGKP